MQTSIHRKIGVVKNTLIAILGYFLQKTNVVINGKAKAFDKITAFLGFIIAQKREVVKQLVRGESGDTPFRTRTQLNFEPYGSRRKDLVDIFAPVRTLGAQDVGNEISEKSGQRKNHAVWRGFPLCYPNNLEPL